MYSVSWSHFPMETYQGPFHPHSQITNHKWTYVIYDTQKLDAFWIAYLPSVRAISHTDDLPENFTIKQKIIIIRWIRNTFKGTLKYFVHKIGRNQWDRGSKNKGVDIIRQVADSFYFLDLDVGVTAPTAFSAGLVICW